MVAVRSGASQAVDDGPDKGGGDFGTVARFKEVVEVLIATKVRAPSEVSDPTRGVVSHEDMEVSSDIANKHSGVLVGHDALPAQRVCRVAEADLVSGNQASGLLVRQGVEGVGGLDERVDVETALVDEVQQLLEGGGQGQSGE